MPYFAVPYTIFFEDTMAYGSHHFLTNFRFQCIVRETLIFEYLLGQAPQAAAEFADVVMLTREGYSRNYAPAMLGERVAILLSFSDPTRSSIRLCIRTVRADGEPIAAGFQTIVFAGRKGDLLPFPRILDAFTGSNLDLSERLIDPPFSECVVAGVGLATIFNKEARALAHSVCAPGAALSGIVGRIPETKPLTMLASPVILTFPGQGSFDAALVKALSGTVAGGAEIIHEADRVAHATVGASLQDLLAAGESSQAELLRACPNLDQFGLFVLSVLAARHLNTAGVVAGAVLGHSFGEIAALCVAGAFGVKQGLQIVAERVQALRQFGAKRGGMMAVATDRAIADELIDPVARKAGVCVAVVNHATQTVLSGPLGELQRLQHVFAAHRATATMLTSRYPFHSAELAQAARSFASGIRGFARDRPTIPVCSPIAGGFYVDETDFALTLASHLTRKVDFPAAIEAAYEAGGRVFIECGAGPVLTRLVNRSPHAAHLSAVAAMRSVGTVQADLAAATAAATGTAGPATTNSLAKPGRTTPSAVNPAATTVALVPVAIVAMGAVLPGAENPQALWRNMLEGVSGISHLRTLFPEIEADFGCDAIIPDKSYSLLSGIVPSVPFPDGAPYSRSEFDGLSKAQRLLVAALRQCAPAMWTKANNARVSCLLGSTADGVQEYDDALFCHTVARLLEEVPLPAGINLDVLRAALRQVPEWRGDGDPEAYGPYPSYRQVVERMLGQSAQMLLVDAACASSLYTMDLGVRQLSTQQVDIVYAGGVFSPGPANAALFAQFGGLSATGSRPFDDAADGVIFGEGAAILVLKRLDDAIAAGDQICGVIRRTGLSSDGRSPSVNVPRMAGQSLAVRRAYSDTLDIATVQYVEAHATATPVGDATEFASLSEVFGQAGGPRIALGSIKSLLGHTGWLAGASSVIKVCLAMAARQIPPQMGYKRPNPKIDPVSCSNCHHGHVPRGGVVRLPS